MLFPVVIIRAEASMKKICLSILVMVLLVIPASAENIRIAAMRGPTAMGLCGLMEKATEGPVSGNSYEFTLEGSPDAVVPLVVRGDVDIAAIPANLAHWVCSILQRKEIQYSPSMI